MKDRLIFITNDDGFDSLGIKSVIDVAKEFGRVVVIAPETMQSGQSHAITMFSPLSLRCVSKSEGVEIYACNGTPVDCVKMAFDHVLLDQKVDLVISGINHGSNSAINVLYSGTMGAAIEGSFYGCPTIGFSLLDHDENADFTTSKHYCSEIITSVLGGDVDLPMCLNVNIPKGELETIKGVKVCRQCKGFWRERFVCRQDPRGQDYFWLTGEFFNEEPLAEDTDNWALYNNYVSVVPIKVDLTDYSKMSSLQNILHFEK